MLSAYVSSKRNWAIAASLVAALSGPAQAGGFVQHNLVSDISGLATITDPLLVNPWGFSHSATSPFWISDQGTNDSTLYAVTGATNVTKVPINGTGFVGIPTTASGPQGPTGQVNVGAAAPFVVNGQIGTPHANFLFADLNGTISAWSSGATAFIQATGPAGTVFTGLTVNQAQNQLFAAAAGGIQAFNSTYGSIANPFTTPAGIAALNLVPFNVKDLGGNVYVTYAPAGLTNQRNASSGQGAVAVFDESGTLLHVIIGGELASPWGLAIAPTDFGPFGSALLVGNFSFLESEINAFDPVTGTFLGTIPIDTGGNTPGGLWEIGFGIGGNNGDPHTLYFTDGINGERNGLFAAIAVPEPFTLSIFGAGLAGTAFLRFRRRKKVTAE